jgi:hypothetical protein
MLASGNQNRGFKRKQTPENHHNEVQHATGSAVLLKQNLLLLSWPNVSVRDWVCTVWLSVIGFMCLPIVYGTGWSPGPICTGAENLAPHRVSIPGPSSSYRVSIPTELSWPVYIYIYIYMCVCLKITVRSNTKHCLITVKLWWKWGWFSVLYAMADVSLIIFYILLETVHFLVRWSR